MPSLTTSPLVTPKPLPAGGCLGIISPAAPSSQNALNTGVELLQAQGYRVKLFPNAAASHHHLAGTDAQRLADLHAAFADSDVDVILCSRGGYGCMRLLDKLDWDLLRANPKWLVGFSDVTALQIALYQQLGWKSLYGPMLTSNLVDDDPALFDWHWSALHPLLGGEVPSLWTVPNTDDYHAIHAPTNSPNVVEAPLLGGNLSLLSALCGTPWQPRPKNHLLFIEDWNESHYTLDRKFQQLKLAGVLEGITGLLLCDFSGIAAEPDGWPLVDFFKDWFADSPFPVGYGLSVGHGNVTATLPQGGTARWDVVSGQLTLV
ncbi:MAG: LD-carboxypeptidase [Vampirovibrionales bacterium]|nr:LD-carboxypeptidase [Vampirovibrionales bacterium]